MQWILIGIIILGTLIAARKWSKMIRQQAYEKTQEEASLEKLRFLQRLDHELKNPLTAMQIALANLEDTTNIENQNEIRASLRGQILRISHLISDLRKLVTLERGAIEQIPVNVANLLNEITLIIHDEEATFHRNLIADFDPTALPSLIGDHDLLQLAVYNLVDNARKFTQKDDTITLRAYVDDDSLVIQVVDTGRGIPEKDMPYVWEDLYRSPDVQGIPGSGIGLAMVKGIIELHNGTASIDSTVGNGTTVTLRLPTA